MRPIAEIQRIQNCVHEAQKDTCARLILWLRSSPRPPAQVAFTEGPLRQVAYVIETELEKR